MNVCYSRIRKPRNVLLEMVSALHLQWVAAYLTVNFSAGLHLPRLPAVGCIGLSSCVWLGLRPSCPVARELPAVDPALLLNSSSWPVVILLACSHLRSYSVFFYILCFVIAACCRPSVPKCLLFSKVHLSFFRLCCIPLLMTPPPVFFLGDDQMNHTFFFCTYD